MYILTSIEFKTYFCSFLIPTNYFNISVSLSEKNYAVNKKAKEVVYEEVPIENVKIESNPSYGVPSQLTASMVSSQVVEEKGQSSKDKTAVDYI